MIETIDPDQAKRWISESLAEGSRLAKLMQPYVERMRHASLLGAPGAAPHVLDNTGRGVASADANADVARFLEANRKFGFCTLLVEDDMARKGDPYLTDDVAFVDDRVIYWTEIDPGASSATRLLRNGSSGYPLNAFVSRSPIADMNCFRGRQLDSALDSICADVSGVIVSVFDGESFVATSSNDLFPVFRNVS